jgi:hypothetical protein
VENVALPLRLSGARRKDAERTALTDWWLFLPMIGAGAGLILLVTLVSLPALWRLMGPDGLRTE